MGVTAADYRLSTLQFCKGSDLFTPRDASLERRSLSVAGPQIAISDVRSRSRFRGGHRAAPCTLLRASFSSSLTPMRFEFATDCDEWTQFAAVLRNESARSVIDAVPHMQAATNANVVPSFLPAMRFCTYSHLSVCELSWEWIACANGR